MDTITSVAIYGGSASVGFLADRTIQLPAITGTTLYDNIIDVALGLAVTLVGLKVLDGEAGKITAFAGIGYTASALLNASGIYSN